MSSSHKPYFPQKLHFLLSSKMKVFCSLSLILMFLTIGPSLFIPSEIHQVCVFLLIVGTKHLVCLFSLKPCVWMSKLPVFQVPLWYTFASFCLFVVRCLDIFSILQGKGLWGADVPPFLSIYLRSVEEYMYLQPHSSIPSAI